MNGMRNSRKCVKNEKKEAPQFINPILNTTDGKLENCEVIQECHGDFEKFFEEDTEFLKRDPPILTDSEETEDETDEEDVLPALRQSYYFKVEKEELLQQPPFSDAEDNNDEKTLPALRQLYKHVEDLPTLTDTEYTDTDDGSDDEDVPLALNQSLIPTKGFGLRGGHDGKKHQAKINNNLQLSNNNNDCFVNSTIQLLSASGYETFLRTEISNILMDTSSESYTVTKLLASLYSTENRGHLSTATIRRHVALRSGRFYLDLGSQQDAEEFLCALEETISEELRALQEFRSLKSKHWGMKQFRRQFRDNSQDGTCNLCGLYPSIADEPFFMLQLNIPQCASSISLSSLIQSHFSESSNVDKIRCPHCCPHDRVGIKCTNQGPCRGKEAAELCLLKEAPQFLFLQLVRFDGTENKVLTHVKFESELVLPNTDVYEPVAALNHRGLTSQAGHYVTYRKLGTGQWMLYDDTYNRLSSLQEANTPDNYILLFKKKDLSQVSVHLQCSVAEDEPNLSPSANQHLPTLCHFNLKETDSLKDNELHLNSRTDNIQNSNMRKQGIKRTQLVFVDDNDIINIEDKNEEGFKIFDGTAMELPVLSQTNNETVTENTILEKNCRGCGKIMERLLRHLKSKKGEPCMTKYTQEEIRMHTQTLATIHKSNFKEKNKKKIKESSKTYWEKNKETIKERTKVYRNNNKETIKERNKVYRKNNKEKIKERNKSFYMKKRENMTLDESIAAFRAEIVWGALYACVSCHRNCFRNGVVKANIEKLKKHTIWSTAINPSVIKQSTYNENTGLVPNLFTNFYIKNSYWICHTCLKYISRNRLPKMSSENSLQVFNYPDCLRLTEVENVLIAPRINFIKMIKLPSSRMPGIRDRIVNVPITSNTIRQTVESLPRTLEEAQVIPISLRKQKSMVSSHFQQYINPCKIRQAVMFLIGKYPFYEDVRFNLHKLDNILEKLKDDCEEDMEMGDLVNVGDTIVEEDSAEIETEVQYIEQDAVRKHQTDTSDTSLLLPENIESKVRTKLKNKSDKNSLVLAPGEDQIPRNILKEKHPFVLHYPCLFPDGKGGLHDTSRKNKLTAQEWIMQRLLNINPVFSHNKPFLFSAVHYVEQQQLMSRMNISYLRGKMTHSSEGGKFLQTEDGYAVFDGIPGSPRYWQKMKYDLIAKMEQLGPPQFFYTLSCANKRWEDNAATILAKTRPDLKVMHCQEEDDGGEGFIYDEANEKEEYEDEDENDELEDDVSIPHQKKNDYFVHENKAPAAELPALCHINIENHTNDLEDRFKCKIHQNCTRKSIKEFLSKKDENSLQSENVLDVTRNFNNRIRSFRKNILRAKASPLQVRYYHDRVEFQARYVVSQISIIYFL